MTKDEFYDKWLSIFAAGISKDRLDKYVVSAGNYIWHIFSWELLDKDCYVSGDEARRAYDAESRGGALSVNWFSDETPCALSTELRSAAALDEYEEIYIAAEDFSWTYIKTHEVQCGPYFMKKDKGVL